MRSKRSPPSEPGQPRPAPIRQPEQATGGTLGTALAAAYAGLATIYLFRRGPLRRALASGYQREDLAFLCGLHGLTDETTRHANAGSETRPYWYKLAPETENILRAFANFLSKLRDRLRDRKDLTIIESALTDLAGYFYSEVPEISNGTDDTHLQTLGMASLISFAQKVNDLLPYRSEQQRPSPEEKVSRKVVSTWQRLSALFNHENLLISFIAWYLLLFLLFATGFHLALRYIPGVKVDTTVITAIVGGPIATAITAVTIPRVTKKRKQGE